MVKICSIALKINKKRTVREKTQVTWTHKVTNLRKGDDFVLRTKENHTKTIRNVRKNKISWNMEDHKEYGSKEVLRPLNEYSLTSSNLNLRVLETNLPI